MKQPKDYSKGKIYVLRNHTNDKVYVGSTTQTLSRRFSVHKSAMKKQSQIYVAMREIGFENFYIELIEEYPCENIEQLEAREGHWIRELDSYNNGYNGKIQGRSLKEWCKENQEIIRKYKEEWYEDNREELLERNKKYYEENREKVSERNKKHREKNKDLVKEKKKQYYVKNKEMLRGKKKVYTEKHKDMINEKRRETVECECGKTVCKGALSRHKKTQYHLSKAS